jgi:hypothetical protein
MGDATLSGDLTYQLLSRREEGRSTATADASISRACSDAVIAAWSTARPYIKEEGTRSCEAWLLGLLLVLVMLLLALVRGSFPTQHAMQSLRAHVDV